MPSKVFFNLPDAIIPNGKQKNGDQSQQKSTFETNWMTIQEQEMNKESLLNVFRGKVPVIKQKEFLSQEECANMLKVLQSHTIVSRV
jgi:hypothetical protein